MGIILEGPDAAGKSSLGRLISEKSGRPLYLAKGKPKDDPEMWRMIAEQRERSGQGDVVDRISCISQQVYREGLFMSGDLTQEISNIINPWKAEHGLIIYCRPPNDVLLNPNYHDWKDYDTEEWKANVLQNQETYVNRYDLLMAQVPCIVYDWTDQDSAHIRDMLCSLTGGVDTMTFKLLKQMQMKGGKI